MTDHVRTRTSSSADESQTDSPAAVRHSFELRLEQPFWRYFEAFRRHRLPFLLDSADPRRESLSRFSFMGADPFLRFRAKRSAVNGSRGQRRALVTVDYFSEGSSTRSVSLSDVDPIAELRRLLQAHRSVATSEAANAPFAGGAVGYFGYEAGHFIERLPDRGRDDLAFPDIHFGFYDVVLSFDHVSGRGQCSVVGRACDEATARAHALGEAERIVTRLRDCERGWSTQNAPRAARSPSDTVARASIVAEADYLARVERAKSHILAGDVFQICLTHRIEAPFAGDPWSLYQELRRINPAPFAGYLELPEGTIISSSPERFLRLDSSRIAESSPIKGTRPRGATSIDDEALHSELQNSAKDQAENTMIVDLVRNDLGRVCRPGTISVPEFRAIHRYPTVHQMVSTVRGELEPRCDALDLVEACFPGGSMTGAPKIEAMKIIDQLEPVKRGVYAGAFGYLDFSGTMDLSIVIRTIVLENGIAYYGVGGAITSDSDPKSEYRETLDKARALSTAVERTRAAVDDNPESENTV